MRVPRHACLGMTDAGPFSNHILLARSYPNAHARHISTACGIAAGPLKQPLEVHGLAIPAIKTEDRVRFRDRKPSLDIVDGFALHLSLLDPRTHKNS